MQTARYEKIQETLITERLPNGLTISIVPKPRHNKSYAMFATDYGGADRRFQLHGEWIDTPAGVAHFLEHKMFDMPYGNALNLLSANGASPNAFTSTGLTAYYFESTEHFYENLRVLLEFVSTPLFTAESVTKEQGIIGQEIRMTEDDPGHVIYNNLMRCLYRENPVRDAIAGTIESIAEITDETLNNCHRVFYNPSNMALSVIGNVDPERIIAIAREILPQEPGERPRRDYGREGGGPNKTLSAVNMEVSAPQFLIGAVVEPKTQGRERLRQQLVGEMALRMLFGRSSPLYTGLYADGLINGSFEYELDYTAGTAMVMVGGESRDIPGLMERVRAHLDSVAENGPDTDLFEKTKKANYGSLLRLCDTFSGMAFLLSVGVFASFNPFEAFELSGEVKPGDIRDFVWQYLGEGKTALSIINPITSSEDND